MVSVAEQKQSILLRELDVVVGGSRRRHKGVNIKIFCYRVCEDPMHCCSAVLDPKLLVKAVHSPYARVTREIRDDAIQQIKYCTCACMPPFDSESI